MKLAQKFTATYLQGEYGVSAYDILQTPGMKVRDLRMINYTAGDDIRQVEAMKAAAGLLHFFTSLSMPFEVGGSLQDAFAQLTELIKSGDEAVGALGEVVDANYKFTDE